MQQQNINTFLMRKTNMKYLNFAVASIVDANTGHGLNRHYMDQFGSNYSTDEKQARSIRSRSFLNLLGAIKASVQNFIEDSKTEARNHQATKDLFQLDDRLLRDIGLSRDDLYELRLGSNSFEALNARRKQGKGQIKLRQTSGKVSNSLRGVESANQEKFEIKKCA